MKIEISGQQTIATVEASHTRLVNALAESADVVADCGKVTEADVAFVQVLLAARRDAEAAGRRFALHAPAAGALGQALTKAGFARPGQPGTWIDPFWAAER